MLRKKTIEDFIEDVASHEPTPGGGSVSALSGAIGTALGLMVCRLTVGKKKYSDVEAEITAIMKELEEIMERFKQLIDEDSKSYEGVVNARRENTGIQNALISATKVPHEIAWHGYRALLLLKTLAEKGNVNAISDIFVGAHMLKCAIHGGIANAKINLLSIEDETFIEKTNVELDGIEKDAEKTFNETVTIIKSRMVMK